LRIVSLLPSATEIVAALGLEDRLVGVSHECDWPPSVARLPKVTSSRIAPSASSQEIDKSVREHLSDQMALYDLDGPTLERLQPDLIVTQALCDVCAVAEEDVRALAAKLPGPPRIVNLEPTTLDQVIDGIRQVAQAAGVPERSELVIAGLKSRIEVIGLKSRSLSSRPRVVVLEWIDPPFSSGHWTPELVELAGGLEPIGQAGLPSRTITWDDVVEARPDVLLLACCGFGVERTLEDLPILKAKPGWDELPAVRAGNVFAVDGSSYFSRPGPRLVDSLEILAHALHPEIHPLPEGRSEAVRVPL